MQYMNVWKKKGILKGIYFIEGRERNNINCLHLLARRRHETYDEPFTMIITKVLINCKIVVLKLFIIHLTIYKEYFNNNLRFIR